MDSTSPFIGVSGPPRDSRPGRINPRAPAQGRAHIQLGVLDVDLLPRLHVRTSHRHDPGHRGDRLDAIVLAARHRPKSRSFASRTNAISQVRERVQNWQPATLRGSAAYGLALGTIAVALSMFAGPKAEFIYFQF